MTDIDRILTKEQLAEIVPYDWRYLLRLEAAGQFPKRIKLGNRRMGWSLQEINTWLEAKKAERTTN